MSKFKVGDVCEWVYSTENLPLCDTVIVAVRPDSLEKFGRTWRVGHVYFCEDPDGKRYGAYADQIRLKRPPSTYDGNQTGSWDLCCGFNPYKRKERA